MLNIDILLVLAIGLLQAGQAVCGVCLTESNRRKIVITMIALGILTVLAGVYAAYRSGEAQAGMISGGDSFAVAKLYSISGNTAHLAFQQRGDYPLREVGCTLIDTDRYNDWYRQHPPQRPEDKFPDDHDYVIGDMPKFGTATKGTLELPPSGKVTFQVNCVAFNGYWLERMNVRKINGQWLQAVIVQRNIPERKGKAVIFAAGPVFTEADDGYPRKPDGNIDWNY